MLTAHDSQEKPFLSLHGNIWKLAMDARGRKEILAIIMSPNDPPAAENVCITSVVSRRRGRVAETSRS